MPERNLESLIELVAQLRAPDGCPWDRAQTHQSLTGFLIEEAYEVIHAIEENDGKALQEELGDLLLHVAFHIQLGREAGAFDLDQVLEAIHEKVIRRHPHVFAKTAPNELESIKLKWEELKAEESQSQTKRPVPFPALVEARKFFEKRANLGIEADERIELAPELADKLASFVESEPERVGELILKIVALARREGVESEQALKRATRELSSKLDLAQENATGAPE